MKKKRLLERLLMKILVVLEILLQENQERRRAFSHSTLWS
ncbi:hypothetical protein Goshw_006488 [Gossypium schwendimanii]|uniref:Uncharacterized protein n=1 Tax=Gossypium schwendimanii TaxID=34291 RepID=A0A7J9L1H4_GOSSC|nr:hypothetical protein [Gossypium schwendimanii]